jgi:hypothetical protein
MELLDVEDPTFSRLSAVNWVNIVSLTRQLRFNRERSTGANFF